MNENNMSKAGASADGESTAVFAPLDLSAFAASAPSDEARSSIRPRKRHVIWPWIVLAVLAVLGAVAGGGIWFFQSHALPGVTLWGTPVTGRSYEQIVSQIDDAVNGTAVNASYNGTTAKVTLKDLGLSVDSDAIATQVMDAKRDDAWWQRYAFWNTADVSTEPANADAAVPDTLNAKLSIEEVKPVDAAVQLNADASGFDVVPGQQGQGADPVPVAQAAVKAVETLGGASTQTVEVKLDATSPAVSDDIANQAKATLDNLVQNPVSITIDDHQIATIDAAALAASTRIDANENGKLADSETRSGYVVFDANKLQQYYDDSIKTTLQTNREDRDVIVNNNGDEIDVLKEGHDGVTIAADGDTNVGHDAVAALANGGGSVTVEGTVDPMQTKKTKRHVIVDLSDNKVYAYENDKLIRTMSMSAGQGNDRKTGECTGGDLCTPTGDFTIWLKYESQDMSGNLTLSDGSKESWDVKGVGYVNYFSHSGCAIHRIATQTAMNDSQVAALGNTSHGCVGIGWDQAEWFYGWAVMGTSVHVQV
ncbi:L,D-transpeptidase [Bifidobacterium sp. SO1]|uniref:L,D-transpeptidase n=1 Tax=Bifidobacterium sp. SO1 TaxID=2809029 RepID=UPI001BDD9856|nr:L,D-transpeptidase [Bifidobacterium sp. SO1]MBT1161333.1 L,D-transpeptidase family protein [Bifidobacterium sp. SO1]